MIEKILNWFRDQVDEGNLALLSLLIVVAGGLFLFCVGLLNLANCR